MNILDGLNPPQLNAVTSRSNALLVLAGPGSGKTAVLTRRTAFLVQERGVSPHNILLLTFTRKAANEMKERLTTLLGEKEVRKLTVGTFHAVSLRILEQFGYHLGYQKHITVYDEIDQRDILTMIISELGLTTLKPEAAQKEMQAYAADCDKHEIDRDYALVFTEYRNRLKAFNAVDFTLLLTEVLRLFREFPEVYNHFHDKFNYVFIDEYQDVDRTQYYLHEAIKPDNVFAVGDVDQSIYAFRGSDITIVQDFEKQHAGAEVILLEQSFRCSSKILDAANSLIGNNPRPYAKELWTNNKPGSVDVMPYANQDAEAAGIAKNIQMVSITTELKEIAVLTRTHRQHEALSKEFIKHKIPFKPIGKEIDFWKRTASRMIIAVFKVLHNGKNTFHFSRVCRHILYPMDDADYLGWEVEALKQHVSAYTLIIEKMGGPFKELVTWYEEHKYEPMGIVLQAVLERIPIKDYFAKQGLYTKAGEIVEFFAYATAWELENPEAQTVEAFLEYLASQEIQTEIDDKNEVKLMTIHAAKGLEWSCVFVAGNVEGKLPSKRSVQSGQLEEERRLEYVAITRAKERLILTYYEMEVGEHHTVEVEPSRFLYEMDLLRVKQ